MSKIVSKKTILPKSYASNSNAGGRRNIESYIRKVLVWSSRRLEYKA